MNSDKIKLKLIRDRVANEREIELEFWWLFRPANFVYKYFWWVVGVINAINLYLLYLSFN